MGERPPFHGVTVVSVKLLGSGPGMLREHGLDPLPQSLGNDGLMLSGIGLPFVDHLAHVEAVAQQAVDVAGIPGAPRPEIARKMYRRAGVFWKEKQGGKPEANPWGVNFMQMLNMTSDSGLFRTREELIGDGWELRGNVFTRDGERYLPLYEAKLFHQYDHRFATFDGAPAQAIRSGNARAMTSDEKADPETVVLPRYWVPEEEVMKRLDKSELTPTLFEPSDRATSSQSWHATRSQGYHERDQRTNGSVRNDSSLRSRSHRNDHDRWFLAFRNIARATDQRTAIAVVLRGVAMNEGAPLIHLDYVRSLQVFRDITNATNARTLVVDNIPQSAVGNNAPVINYQRGRAIASALVLANMNSLPLDWASRLSVGGTHMSFFIVKQLPVLPPEAYLEEARPGLRHVELVVPRVLELTYTADDLKGFANDIGYEGLPFPWDEVRRHYLKCELDAIFAELTSCWPQADRAEGKGMMETGEKDRPKRRMRPTAERRRVVEETYEVGASVVRVARRNGLNANQVFQWRRLYRDGKLQADSRLLTLLPV